MIDGKAGRYADSGDHAKVTSSLKCGPILRRVTSRASRSWCKDGFYDGIVFHRVIDGFMAQTGCPQGTGTGGSGKKLKAEFNA